MAIWWVSLAVAFLLHRGDDVGRLPALTASLLASLLRGPLVGGAGLLASLGGLTIAGLMVLAWYGLGAVIVRPLSSWAGGEADESGPIPVAGRFLVGAGAWSIVWFFLGVGHLYRPWVATAALLVGVALAVAALRHRPPAPPQGAGAPWRALLALVVTGQALALVAALAPPTAKDTLLYHFALPKAYIAAGWAVDVPYNVASYYPLGVEMQAVWAMLLGGIASDRVGEAAAGAALFAFAPLLATVTYGWARDCGLDRRWAATAALLIAWIPTVYDVAASGYVDLAMAAYTALAVLAFGRWWTTLDPARLVWVAIGTGCALSIKLSAAFLILTLGLLALVRALGSTRSPAASARAATPGSVALAALSSLTLAGLLASPWYIRNWARTGSPLFPFYLEIWPARSPGWDVERSRLYETWFSAYGDASTALDYVLTPIRLSLAAQPDQPPHYDGVLGIVFLLALPCIVWALWSRRLRLELRLSLIISACLFVFWLFSSQQLRYLVPALPGIAVAAAAAGAHADGGSGRAAHRLLLAAAALNLSVILAWFTAVNPVRVVLGGEPRPAYLARRLDYFPYYQLINSQLPPSARVWLIDVRRDTYHLDRPHFSDFIFEDYTLSRYVRAAASAGEIRARVQAEGITHLLVRHDVLLDYRRSPIVDDRRSRDENVTKLQLLTAFFTEGTRLLKGDQKFWLIELPAP